MDRYAVFGNPVKHSKSPQIHTIFSRQTGQQLQYRAQRVAPGEFAAAATQFFDQGGRGLNVTVPFKIDAFEFATHCSDRARRAGAVNTLTVQRDGSILGDNTDGVGLVHDLCENLGWAVADRRLLILGAGGAVRGILEPLLQRQPDLLVIANRTVSRAQELAREFGDLGDVRACSYDALNGSQYDVVINATSTGLQGELPPLPEHLLTERGCCYDLVYGSAPTPFMRWAARHAAWAVADGLGMLVEQAAESFHIWRGVRPNTRPVIDQMRLVLAA